MEDSEFSLFLIFIIGFLWLIPLMGILLSKKIKGKETIAWVLAFLFVFLVCVDILVYTHSK